MNYREELRHPLRTLRTAPIPLGGTAVSLGMSATMLGTAAETQGDVELLSLGMAGATAVLAVRGLQLASRSIRLRGRLEQSLDKGGFNERVFATTTNDWCTRQTAIVACEQYDAVDSYNEFCEANQQDAKFTWLPHM